MSRWSGSKSQRASLVCEGCGARRRAVLYCKGRRMSELIWIYQRGRPEPWSDGAGDMSHHRSNI